ncbi:hypothetical protein [Pseudorhodoferax sp.]|uniref:hypothetical protein n=1 Tax=Pseudorhodoferax sp. TaxID=1993553 RepID=UPI002DD6A915|nr:hypothetical protein [Pseudorhodoferax sp.]
MKTSQRLGLLATLLALGGLLPAAHAEDTTPPREQRMGEALQNYRDAAAKNPQPGPVARAEESAKRGAHRAGAAVQHGAQRTGEVIKYGAQRTGEAVGTGAEKAGNAIRRGGEALKDKTGG